MIIKGDSALKGKEMEIAEMKRIIQIDNKDKKVRLFPLSFFYYR